MKNGLVISEYGTKYWYRHGKLHREDGPAVEYVNGEKQWYLDDKLHRKDGPAIEYANGFNLWFINNKLIDCASQEEFEKLIKLKAFW